jgi:hypothetical protein
MFWSLGRNGAAVPAADQHAILPDGVDEMADPLEDEDPARHANPSDDAGNGEAGPVGAPSPDSGEADVAGEWDGSEDFRFVVRPYTWTRGRTRPVQDLAVETLVSTSDEGQDLTSICSAEHAAIAQLCAELRSVAEVAALLALPLGVARVLLADMIDAGLLHMHSSSSGWGGAPDLSLLERVLDGLYRL